MHLQLAGCCQKNCNNLFKVIIITIRFSTCEDWDLNPSSYTGSSRVVVVVVE